MTQMIVIARHCRVAALIVLLCAAGLRADDSAEIHSVVSAVAERLSSGNAADAMSSFSKSYPDFDKLSSDFDALTGAYYVESRIDFSDEEIASGGGTVKVHWDMTLTTRQSGFTGNKSADLTLKLVREGKHWRITALQPIAFFDPGPGS